MYNPISLGGGVVMGNAHELESPEQSLPPTPASPGFAFVSLYLLKCFSIFVLSLMNTLHL